MEKDNITRNLLMPLAAILIGFLAVVFTQASVPPSWGPYFSLAALAGLDSVCGGIRAGMEGKFSDDILLSGFLMNTLLAAGLAYLGDQLGVDLFLAAVVLLGGRVFLNISLIRRYLINEWQLARKKEG